jgi:methylenetetrahydrofolate dehydrogenase (NADP+)/methenyltetrahydrofolate cyclohydrolase
MLIDGRKIADEMLTEIKEQVKGKDLTLSVFVVGENPATESFIKIKKEKAREVGIKFKELRFNIDVLEEDLVEAIKEEAKEENSIIVQLPLPGAIDKSRVLNSIPPHLDVDVLSNESNKSFEAGTLKSYPPVVGAISEILEREEVELENKKVVIVGRGLLVGKPAEAWFKSHKGADVVVLDSKVKNIEEYTKDSDIIVSGVGIPNLITREMIKGGAILLDAGTSEESNELRGDISLDCEEKAKFQTPVPGGIGPITVAVLFRNIVNSR